MTRLPKWVEWGAAALAVNAGVVNAVGLLSVEHQAISHVTGTVSWLGLALARGDAAGVLQLLLIVLAFVVGAAASGALVQDRVLRLGHRYSAALLAESALLAAALAAFRRDLPIAALAASAACGVQNGLASTFSATAIRTTHVTGIVTDLGIALGHALCRRPIDRRRVRLHLLVLAGFAGGALAGAVAWLQVGFATLWGPVGTCAGLALACSAAAHRANAAAGASAAGAAAATRDRQP